VTAHETRPAAGRLVIDASYAGLPELAHGGYVAGLLTAALGADSSRVNLRRAIAPARALQLTRTGAAEIELHGDGELLADGVAAEVLLDVPPLVAPADALAAARRFPDPIHHPVPGCVVCGPAHPRGLRIFPGPVTGRALVAALWVPPARLADDSGALPDALVAAALDCPQLWALMVHAPAASRDRVVTAVLETRLDDRVIAGEPHVVMGWPIGRDGRRRLAGAAIVGPDGGLRAAGRQTAAVVGGWGVPLGRDHWDAALAGDARR
jgi:hypothetical protein